MERVGFMADNIMGIVLTDYVKSIVSTLTGGRSLPDDIDQTPAAGRVTLPSVGDLALFAFGDPNNATRVFTRDYPYVPSSQPTLIYNPQQRDSSGNLVNWTAIASATWPGVPNTHGAFSASSWANADNRQRILIATGYDLNRVVGIDMLDNYAQKTSLLFPDDFNAAIEAAGKTPLTTDPKWHGEDIWVQNIISGGGILTNVYVYGLFNYNPGDDYQTYEQSVVMKWELTVDPSSGVPALNFMDYVRVGKNSTSFVLYDNKLFITAIGGMQALKPNDDTGIWYVDVSTPATSMSVVQVVTPSVTPAGDFRDICFVDNRQVYTLVGHFVNNYNAFQWSLYSTTLPNLLNPTPNPWTLVKSGTDAGDYWALLVDPPLSRLYFIRGQNVDVYTSLPIVQATLPLRTYSTADFAGGDQTYNQINSAILIAQDGPAPASGDEKIDHHHHHKPAAAKLALQARNARNASAEDNEKK
jgi:hypothetical protein